MNTAAFIESLEGKRRKVYNCEAGCPTIGKGHKLTCDELEMGVVRIGDRWVQWRDGLDDEQIDTLLAQDMAESLDAIKRLVKVPLTDYQRIALESFVFNAGAGAFAESTLLKLLNDGRYDDVPAQMMRWVHVTKGGEKVKSRGLINRRTAEVAMWRGESLA